MLKVKAFRTSRWLLVGAWVFLAGWAAQMPGAGAPGKDAGETPVLPADAGASGATNPAAVDLLVLIVSEGGGPDRIAFTYDRPVPKQQAQRDLEALAKELGQPVPQAKITTEAIRAAPNSPRMTSVETAFPGLVDRTGGRLPLAPHARTFRRFPRVRVTYFVFGPFKPANPVAIPPGEGVEWTASGQPPVFTFDLRRTASATAQTRPGASPTRLLVLPIVAAVMAGVAVYLAARAKSQSGRPSRSPSLHDRYRPDAAPGNDAGQAPPLPAGALPADAGQTPLPAKMPAKRRSQQALGATSAQEAASCPLTANERER